MNYKIVDFLKHMDDARAEAVTFLEVKKSFQTERERKAYEGPREGRGK